MIIEGIPLSLHPGTTKNAPSEHAGADEDCELHKNTTLFFRAIIEPKKIGGFKRTQISDQSEHSGDGTIASV